MPEDVIQFIARYGYLAIFILVFLQESGFPNPIPNELVLLFSGYLIYSGIFKFYDVILVALIADFLGTSILYFTFRAFGIQLLKMKPRWFPVSRKRIESFSQSLSEGGLSAIFICRLTPFIRGYTSVISGLMHIRIKHFLTIAILSATVWASAYILTGWILGPWWKQIEGNPHWVRNIMLLILILVLTLFGLNFLLKKLRVRYKGQ
jgi:membrane protein DedA with SNARE-associated domain